MASGRMKQGEGSGMTARCVEEEGALTVSTDLKPMEAGDMWEARQGRETGG
jgi:hypothetical protein